MNMDGRSKLSSVAATEKKSAGTVDGFINKGEAEMAGISFYDPNKDGLINVGEGSLANGFLAKHFRKHDDNQDGLLSKEEAKSAKLPFVDRGKSGLMSLTEAFLSPFGYADKTSGNPIDGLINKQEAETVGLSFYDPNKDGFMDKAEKITFYKPAVSIPDDALIGKAPELPIGSKRTVPATNVTLSD